MRQIKFRAWDGKLLHYDGFYLDDEGSVFILNTDDYNDRLVQKTSWNLSQFTGSTDVNGKEIYEGDIVSNNGDLQIVEWGHYGCHPFEYSGENTINPKDVEIVGNIYENPELINTNL